MPDEKVCPIASLRQMQGISHSPSARSCIREKCEWWTENPETKAGRCALPMIEAMLREIMAGLQK